LRHANLRFKETKMRGSTFAKMLTAMGSAPGSMGNAAEEAARRWGPESKAAKGLKAAVLAGTTDNWGSPLIGDYAEPVAEFVSLVHERTIPGRLLESLRRVPARTPYLAQSSGATGNWVAQAQPMPISALSLTRQTLSPLKVTAAVLQSEELFASPDGERIIIEDLVGAVADATDLAFIDSDNAGVADEKPASITYGVTATDVGTDMTAVDEADLATALADWPGDFRTAAFVAHPELIMTLPNLSFPSLDARTGGNIKGIPMIPSRQVPKDSGGKHQLVILDAAAIAYTSDPAATQVRSSHQGAIEMLDSGLTQDPPTGSSLVGLWQNNLVAIAALLWQNWAVERDGTVVILNTTGATS